MQPKSKRNQRGFTLVELMVAVTIIGILAAVGIPRLFSYVRTSSTAEVSQNAGKIIAGLEGYTQSAMQGNTELVDDIDGTTVLPDGTGSLTTLVPQIEVPTGSNFSYTVYAAEATAGPSAGDVVYCIVATGLDGASVTGGQVVYSSASTDVDTWDGHMNRRSYIDGDTTLVSAAGGYCAANGANATATFTAAE